MLLNSGEIGAPWSRPVSVLLRLQVRLEDRRRHQHCRRLRNPVPQAGDAQGQDADDLNSCKESSKFN